MRYPIASLACVRLGLELSSLTRRLQSGVSADEKATKPVVRLTSLVYNDTEVRMIRSYRDRDPQCLAAGEKVRQWEPFRRQAEKRLRILDAATSLGDLAALNSNRLEALRRTGVDGLPFVSTANLFYLVQG